MAAQQIARRDLKLADVIRLSEHIAYNTAVVVNIRDGAIHVERPYMVTADFSYTGGVIAYIGVERFSFYQDSDALETVLERKELK